MRAIKRKRPRSRDRTQPPPGVALETLAKEVRYVGSAEHKTAPSPAGPPRPRSDASKCDPQRFAASFKTAERWLRSAVKAGQVGAPWKGRFPRYAWYRDGDTVYEAFLTNEGQGHYKGYPLERDEWPEFLTETS